MSGFFGFGKIPGGVSAGSVLGSRGEFGPIFFPSAVAVGDWLLSNSATLGVGSPILSPYCIANGGGKTAVASFPVIQTADAGATWAVNNTAPLNDLFIAFGAGLWVMAGGVDSGPPSLLTYATSPDLVTWTNRTVNLTTIFGIIFNHLFQICALAYVNNTFFLIFESDNGGDSMQIVSSADGINWANASGAFLRAGSTADMSAIAFGNGIYVNACGTHVYAGADLTAPTDTVVLSADPPRAMMAFGNGLFVTGDTNASRLYTSVDGVNWTARAVPPDPTIGPFVSIPDMVQFANGKFYIGVEDGGGNTRFFSSANAVAWTEETSPNSPDAANFFIADGGSVVAGEAFTNPLVMIYNPP